jgi:hypothetical protein
VIVAALSASACAPPTPAKPPRPSPSSTALFASDEEALAAAEKAYREYQHVSDAILIDGGADPERLLEVATQAQYEYEKAGYDKILSENRHSTGGSTFDSMRIESWNDPPYDGQELLTVYVCDDYSAVDIVDKNGTSVVAPERPDRFPRVATFSHASGTSGDLRVSSIVEWTGESFC